MIYFLVKCALSGIIIAVVSEVAKRSPALGALIVSLPLVSPGNFVALARYRRCRTDCQSRAIDILVCAAFAANVSGPSGDAAGRHRLLAEHGCSLRSYDWLVFGHCMDAGQIWDKSLAN
jgi:hypothetical protein